MTEKIKVIMDCDPGIDDALAMAYVGARKHRSWKLRSSKSRKTAGKRKRRSFSSQSSVLSSRK